MASFECTNLQTMYFLQYYEMSYGLNVEMHKQVSMVCYYSWEVWSGISWDHGGLWSSLYADVVKVWNFSS